MMRKAGRHVLFHAVRGDATCKGVLVWRFPLAAGLMPLKCEFIQALHDHGIQPTYGEFYGEFRACRTPKLKQIIIP